MPTKHSMTRFAQAKNNMIKNIFTMAIAAIAAMAISSCDEDTKSLGYSLTNESDKLSMTTNIYHASSKTIMADSVLTSSIVCYLGSVEDPQTKSIVKSEFTTQFNILDNLYISDEKYFDHRDKSDNGLVADSCDIILYSYTPFNTYGNLLAAQLRVRELKEPVSQDRYYYSNYDPEPLIRTDEGAINVDHVFTFTNLTDEDSKRSTATYINNIRIPLNQPYTKDGKTYSNYGTYILRELTQRLKNKNTKLLNSYVFAKEVCPGLCFEITDGLGFHTEISDVGLRMYYHLNKDSMYNATLTLAGTEEVMHTTTITNDKTRLTQLAAEANNSNYSYLKTPAGLFTEVTLPIDEIWAGHESDSLLAAKVTFQRMSNEKVDKRSLGTPQTLLITMKDSLYSFFEKKKLPDNRTTYLSNYNSSYNTYTFTNLSNLVTALRNIKEKGLKSDANWIEKNPNWNKVVLVPVYAITSSSSSTPTRVINDMSLTSTRILGGKEYPIEVNVVYAKFKK